MARAPMRVALTYNLQLSETEEEAEFDRPETVESVAQAIRAAGHVVDLVEASGPASRLVARLEALRPDLVFNMAEGRTGRWRQAFFPALFDQLGVPSTGSDAYVCMLTLDKRLTKKTVQGRGIPTPRWQFVDSLEGFATPDLSFPVIVKPNFEGSAKGIGERSVVEGPEGLVPVVAELLGRYPSGVLIEEFVEGVDVSVTFLGGIPGRADGVLPPTEYVIADNTRGGRAILDYELKHRSRARVSVQTRLSVSPSAVESLVRHARAAFRVLGLKDFGRLDFRVDREGGVWFLESDALPSLAPEAEIHLAAAAAGVTGPGAVVQQIVRNAMRRHGIVSTPSRAKARSLRIGLAYNLKRVTPGIQGENDDEAEYDSPKTVQAIREAIASYGHEVVDLEATPELPALLGSTPVDVVFNIAEGSGGRSREAHVPALLELRGIPYTGSDPATLSITLDKPLAKRIVREAGVPTPRFVVMRTGREKLPKEMRFPVIVKPAAEGSSKGVFGASVAQSEGELRELARVLAERYRQPALVEEFLDGREFTVALLGGARPRVLPPMEIVFVNPERRHPVYAFEHKQDWSREIRYDAPAVLDARLRREVEHVARESYVALGCRDVARIDVRLDREGRVNFIECNPLPGLTPGWSDLCLIATSAGMDYRTLIGEIMAPAIHRFREQTRGRRGGQSASG